MTLREIETTVLQLIGYDRYSSLSVDTEASKMEDFSILHTCVNLAREEIKINAHLPEIYAADTLTTIADQGNYSLPTDFDLAVMVFYIDTALNITQLTQLSAQGTSDLIYGLVTGLPNSVSGTPTAYIIAGNSAGLIQITMSPTPASAGELIVPVYKPILTSLTTSTDEDVIMKKYPKTVISFASAYAFQMLKKDQASYDKYYAYGMVDCQKINLRQSSVDADARILAENLLAQRRMDRLTI